MSQNQLGIYRRKFERYSLVILEPALKKAQKHPSKKGEGGNGG
jgi:hypothetical protein